MLYKKGVSSTAFGRDDILKTYRGNGLRVDALSLASSGSVRASLPYRVEEGMRKREEQIREEGNFYKPLQSMFETSEGSK